MKKIRVTVWNEFRQERNIPDVARVYPMGIHRALSDYLSGIPGYSVRTATLDEPEHGLSDDVLNDTDVLLWWGHVAHEEVRDEIVSKVQSRILGGIGLIALHSAHASKLFRKLMGTSGRVRWRQTGEKTRLWVVAPLHPIAAGIGSYIDLEKEEMYGERFGIPTPDELVFIEWFQGGNVLRGGCCFVREKGRIFYFQPGHEFFPTYHNPNILRIIRNAIDWAAPQEPIADDGYPPEEEPLESISGYRQ